MSAIEQMEELINDADRLSFCCNASSPEFIAWRERTLNFLTVIYGDASEEVQKFKALRFCNPQVLSFCTPAERSVSAVNICTHDLQKAKSYLNEYLNQLKNHSNGRMQMTSTERLQKIVKEMQAGKNNKVFIVHGHNAGLKEALARLLEKQGIEPVILSEQANGGKTIIEKFEENSDVSAAICLFTADDEGKAKAADGYKPRARQNVIFEAGYFAGKLGRDRLMILADKNIEIPSDLQGIVYSDTNSWQFEVLKELKIMGFSIDLNKLVV